MQIVIKREHSEDIIEIKGKRDNTFEMTVTNNIGDQAYVYGISREKLAELRAMLDVFLT